MRTYKTIVQKPPLDLNPEEIEAIATILLLLGKLPFESRVTVIAAAVKIGIFEAGQPRYAAIREAAGLPDDDWER